MSLLVRVRAMKNIRAGSYYQIVYGTGKVLLVFACDDPYMLEEDALDEDGLRKGDWVIRGRVKKVNGQYSLPMDLQGLILFSLLQLGLADQLRFQQNQVYLVTVDPFIAVKLAAEFNN